MVRRGKREEGRGKMEERKRPHSQQTKTGHYCLKQARHGQNEARLQVH